MSEGFSTVSTGVFERSGRDKVSDRTFYSILTGSVLYGLIGTAYIANIAVGADYYPGWLSIIFLGLVVPIIGILIAVKSSNPFISFIGYNMVVIPFGVILGPAVNQYSHDVIRNAFGMTAAITIVMSLAGISFPDFFSKIGGFLFVALTSLLVVMIGSLFLPFLRLTIIDYIGAGIFSLYIGYDMHRASMVPKTIDNAIDISIDLYLDIINLFLFILKIMGKK
jgi:FtsH-binding integral membrane protein